MLKNLIVTICLLLSSLAWAQTQTIFSIDALEELELARNLLQRSEAERGRFDFSLVEPIEQLADRYMALNQFDEADELLDRAIQITRFHGGLHTPAQLSLIRKRIDNFSNRFAWADAREQMEYLFEYYHRVPVELNENLLNEFVVLAEQHLRGATEDSEIEQGQHLSRAYQLNQAMLATAIKLYGEDSPMLVPYLYRQVQHLYLAKKSFDRDGRSSANSNFYYTLKGDTWPWSKESAWDFYFSEGLVQLEKIAAIMSRANPPDRQGQAMSRLYIADWQLIFDHADEAVEDYAAAYEALLASGANREQLDSFFGAPRVLPISLFHSSLEAAIDSLASSSQQANAGDGVTHQLSLSEWTPIYPGVRSPIRGFNRAAGASDFAVLEFKLAAENEPSFLFKNRYKHTVGTTIDVDLVEGFSEAGDVDAMNRLEQLRFRPMLRSGKPVESAGKLRYEVARGEQ